MSDKIKLKRALSVKNILDKKYKLLPFTGPFFDAFSQPEATGVWFVWGNSGNGKTSFIHQLTRHLSSFNTVLVNSHEEGVAHTLQQGLKNANMPQNTRHIKYVSDTIDELTARLLKPRSCPVVVLDSFQHMEFNSAKFKEFTARFNKKLLIFISQAEGKQPLGRAAQSAMYSATMKIWIEGYRAFTKGRYYGPKGHYTIWPEKALTYWGDSNETNLQEN